MDNSKNIIELVPKYIPLIQKPYCCNVTCLQMVLYRNGYGLYDQEDLAKYFNIKISKDVKDMFRYEFEYYSESGFDDGLKTVEEENLINNFFKEYKINLEAKAFKYSDIENIEEFIKDNLSKNNDLWIEYRTDEIYGGGEDFMHDGLIESFDGEKVILINSSRVQKQRNNVRLSYIVNSISGKFGRETGFIQIRKIEN